MYNPHLHPGPPPPPNSSGWLAYSLELSSFRRTTSGSKKQKKDWQKMRMTTDWMVILQGLKRVLLRHNGSVNSKHAHPTPGQFCHFVLEKRQMPHGGLSNRVQMPQPGTTPKLHFPVNKQQIPIYGKSVIIWSNSHVKHPTQIAPSGYTVFIILLLLKKISLIWLISVTGL